MIALVRVVLFIVVAVCLGGVAPGPAAARSASAKSKAVKSAVAKAKPFDLKSAVRGYFAAPEAKRADLAKEIAEHASGTQVVKILGAIEPVLAAKVGGLRETRSVNGGSYLILLPNGYSHRRSWPLHIALHGKGESQNAARICDDYWQGAPAAAGFVLACPNLAGGEWKTPAGEALVMAVRRDVLGRYNIRANQVSLGGFSAGAIGAWHIGAKYPDLFAAVMPRSGMGPSSDVDLLRNFATLPVWATHGTVDSNIPISRPGATRSMVTALRKARAFPKTSVYKELKGVAHDFASHLNKSALRWLAARKRSTVREARSVDLVVLPDRREKTAYFVDIESGVRQRLRATVGADNAISLQLSEPAQVTRLTVYINKQVADPGRAVVLRVNGRAFDFRPADDVALALSSYAESHDLRRTFLGRHVVARSQIADLPPDRDAGPVVALDR